MASIHEWKVGYVEYDIEQSDNPGRGAGQVKVSTLHWRCRANDDSYMTSPTDGATAELRYPWVESIGTVSAADQNRVYPLPALQNVPEATFVKWVKQALGDDEVARIEASATAQFEEKVNPTHGGFTPETPDPEQPLP